LNRFLQGQVALVTGASRGIGRAIARTLGRAGATVIGSTTSTRGIAPIEEDMQREGYAGRAVLLDVADPASVDQLGSLISQPELVPSILVNNAGITRDNLVLRMKDEEWNDVIETDLTSVFRLTRLCLRGMMKARAGRIINITSVVALSGNAGQCNYAAAKAGIIGFTKSLAREVGSRGITVNAVAPGLIATDMTGALSEEVKSQIATQTALGRLGTVDEIAQVVAFLASPSASYITGETINVSGGMYMT
jgi:3-oxoacyl-[acyl-carrier protein] reductase